MFIEIKSQQNQPQHSKRKHSQSTIQHIKTKSDPRVGRSLLKKCYTTPAVTAKTKLPVLKVE